MSWFQLGVAYGDLGQSAQAIDAYDKALALNPDYDLAMFNLGGAHWNRGEKIEAVTIWITAIDRFPDHELAAKLRRDMPVFFPQPMNPIFGRRRFRSTGRIAKRMMTVLFTGHNWSASMAGDSAVSIPK